MVIGELNKFLLSEVSDDALCDFQFFTGDFKPEVFGEDLNLRKLEIRGNLFSGHFFEPLDKVFCILFLEQFLKLFVVLFDGISRVRGCLVADFYILFGEFFLLRLVPTSGKLKRRSLFVYPP